MSKIFKSDYVSVGAPKPIKSNIPAVNSHHDGKTMVVHQAKSLEEKTNNIIEDAKQMYLRIIEEANLEAQKIIQSAQVESENIRESSAEQGYHHGYNAGYTEGISMAEDIIQQAAELKQELDERRNAIYGEAECEIMSMVLDISRKVIGEELTQNPDVMISLVRQALEKCAFKDRLVIRVSDFDYEYVNQSRNKIIMLTEGINQLEIVQDIALSKGSCIVETNSGEINAGISVQMNEIQKAFEYLMRNE